jgi:hypothetical protein
MLAGHPTGNTRYCFRQPDPQGIGRVGEDSEQSPSFYGPPPNVCLDPGCALGGAQALLFEHIGRPTEAASAAVSLLRPDERPRAAR